MLLSISSAMRSMSVSDSSFSYGRILDASSISHYEKGTNVRCGESRKLAAPGGDMRNR
jgi:hypothetical protein